MNIRTICTGSFALPMAADEALPLFTPEGERRWAGGSWDPSYPIPAAAADDSATGTVFTTDSDSGTAVWIVIERREDAMRYARVVPDCIAGTISVTCSSAAAGEECRVAVEYDVTTLGPAGGAFVRELESDYDGFLESWRDEIVAALGLEEELPR